MAVVCNVEDTRVDSYTTRLPLLSITSHLYFGVAVIEKTWGLIIISLALADYLYRCTYLLYNRMMEPSPYPFVGRSKWILQEDAGKVCPVSGAPGSHNRRWRSSARRIPGHPRPSFSRHIRHGIHASQEVSLGHAWARVLVERVVMCGQAEGLLRDCLRASRQVTLSAHPFTFQPQNAKHRPQ